MAAATVREPIGSRAAVITPSVALDPIFIRRGKKMIYVTDGVQTVKVTTGAYENYYRPQGFHPVGRGRPEPSVPTAADAVVEEDVDQRLMEKPINKWTKAELAGFAKRNGISLEGVSKVAEVRRLVAARIEAMQAPELIEDVLEG